MADDEDLEDRRGHKPDDFDYRLRVAETTYTEHARIITALIEQNNQRNIAEAKREEQDAQRDRQWNALLSFAKWAAGGIGIAVLTAVANFVLGGGLGHVP